MAFSFNTLVHTYMRDTDGHQMKVVEVTGVDGNYTTGGVIIDPEDFGFSELIAFQFQTVIAGPPDILTWDPENPDPWAPVALVAPMRTDVDLNGDFEWRVLIFLMPAGYGGAQGDGMFELPDGTPMLFVPQNRPTAMIIGKE